MEVRDDNPNYFRWLLRYMYTHDYDKEFTTKLDELDTAQRVTTLIGIYIVADKYDVLVIYERVTKDVEAILKDKKICTPDVLQAAVKMYYEDCAASSTTMTKIIVSAALRNYNKLSPLDSDQLATLLKTQPAVDVALLQRKKYNDLEDYTCSICHFEGVIRYTHSKRLVRRTAFHCEALHFYCQSASPIDWLNLCCVRAQRPAQKMTVCLPLFHSYSQFDLKRKTAVMRSTFSKSEGCNNITRRHHTSNDSTAVRTTTGSLKQTVQSRHSWEDDSCNSLPDRSNANT